MISALFEIFVWFGFAVNAALLGLWAAFAIEDWWRARAGALEHSR